MVLKRKTKKKQLKKKRVTHAKAKKSVAKRVVKKKISRRAKKVVRARKVKLVVPRNFVLGHPVFYTRPPLFVRNKLKKQDTSRKLLSRPEN